MMSQYLNMGIPWRFPWPRVVFCMEEASPGPSEGGENELAENRSQPYCKLISAILRAKMGEIARQNG